jgi:hypothetical protein
VSESRIEPPAVYQHPLAYLLGLEGIALLRAFAGEYDRDFTKSRLAEIRELMDSVEELGNGAVVEPIPTTEGYGSEVENYEDIYRRCYVRGPEGIIVELAEQIG